MYTFHFEVVLRYLPALAIGLKNTILLTLFGMGGALTVALFLSLMVISRRRLVRLPAIVYIEFFRGVPFLVVLVWMFYALAAVTGVSLPAFTAAVISLTVCQSAYSAEVFRAGIESLEKGQMESARTLGMSYSLAMRRIILPQAIRRMVPPLVNSFIGMLKWSSLASIIAVPELLYQGNIIIQRTYRPMEIYTVIAVLYFIVSYPIAMLTRYLERKYDVGRK